MPSLNFNNYQITSYGGQDLKSTTAIANNGNSFQLNGNGWKKLNLPYNVTANTILEFDFKSTSIGDIQGIGFDNDNVINNRQTLKLYGTEAWGINKYNNYQSSAGNWKHYAIPVGEFFKGQYSFLTFTNDNDVTDPKANSIFNNVNIFETAPIQAVSNTITINEDTSTTILGTTLLANDLGPSLKIATVSKAVNLSVALNANGSIFIKPNSNFNGNASFDYLINDAYGRTATTTVKIVVNPVNDAPTAVNDSAITNQNQSITLLSTDLLKNDTDIDGDVLKLLSVNNPIQGTVQLNANGNPVFTPNANFTGDASFDYIVSDSQGGTAKATVKVTVNPNLSLPDLGNKVSPASAPSLPATTDVFNPNFVSTQTGTNQSAPAIAEWTKTANSGQTIVLTGDQFSSDTKFWVYGQTNSTNGALLSAKIEKLDGNVAAITLPNNLPQGSSYLLWAQNSAGYSKPVMLNQSETWWVQESATRGQVASIFGRNLSQNNGTQNSNVYLESNSTGQGYWAKVVAANPYKVDFEIPSALSNGDYKVYLHNGDGAKYGWSKPLNIKVDDGLTYKGPTINVKDFGAVGDGITDDSNAIQAAIEEADKYDMSTVYLPAGTYAVSQSLFVGWDKVRWLGDGKNATTIKAADGFNQYYLFEGSNRDKITFENLGLDANSSKVENLNVVTKIRNSSDIQYLNVKINSQGITPFDWNANDGVAMKNSEIIGPESFLGTAQQVFIDGTKFYGTDYTNTILHGFGTQMLSVTNTTAQSLDPSDPNNGKWAKGRFFADQPHWGMSQNQYFGDNQTIDMAPPPADGIDRNSGEQIMWETEFSNSFGAVTAATPTSLKVNSAPSVDDNWQLTITAGKGQGQTRQIQSFNSATGTYNISQAWNVLPDATSKVMATKIPKQVVVYDNTLDGTKEAYNSPEHVASAGVQAYQGASDLIIDRNTFNELRTGVALWSQGTNGIMPAYFTQITNNTFSDNLTGVSMPWVSGNQGTNILGTNISNNNFLNVNKGLELQMDPSLIKDGNSYYNVNMNVVSNNRLQNVDQFISLEQTNDNIHNTIALQNQVI